MAKAPGFLVWNPARAHPSVQHGTFAEACAEAQRLRSANPGERFYIMAPVMEKRHAEAAQAFSDGKAAGWAEARDEIARGDKRISEAWDHNRRLDRSIQPLLPIARDAEDHQAIVADCLCWFDGFSAAHGRDDRQPFTPDREKLRRLNAVLQEVVGSQRGSTTADDEIPF